MHKLQSALIGRMWTLGRPWGGGEDSLCGGRDVSEITHFSSRPLLKFPPTWASPCVENGPPRLAPWNHRMRIRYVPTFVYVDVGGQLGSHGERKPQREEWPRFSGNPPSELISSMLVWPTSSATSPNKVLQQPWDPSHKFLMLYLPSCSQSNPCFLIGWPTNIWAKEDERGKQKIRHSLNKNFSKTTRLNGPWFDTITGV